MHDSFNHIHIKMKKIFSSPTILGLALIAVTALSNVHAESLEDKLRNVAGEVAGELEGEGTNEEKLKDLGSKLEGIAKDLTEDVKKEAKAVGKSASNSKMSGPEVNLSKLTEEVLAYQDGADEMEGYAVYAKDSKAKLPVVLIVHQWMGLSDYEKTRAQQLAQMGYLAVCVDIYGKGVRPADQQEAGTLATKYKTDRALYRRRLLAGLSKALSHPKADGSKVVAIGYCFGGTGVIELARTGAEVKGVVSFHGGLDSPSPDDGANIGCKVLACHGADDPYVPADELAAFEKEMRDHKVDWQLIKYGGAVHSFTQPMVGSDNSKGAAYNKKADTRSWKDMNQFFNEALK